MDTRLFIDPFLIYADSLDIFAGSHDEIIGFFNSMFTLIARSGCNPRHLAYQQAISQLMLPEVEELCLKYGQRYQRRRFRPIWLSRWPPQWPEAITMACCKSDILKRSPFSGKALALTESATLLGIYFVVVWSSIPKAFAGSTACL